MKTQADRILELLEEAGPAGVSNYQLNRIAFRYSARILDLRKDGHVISAIKGKERSEWKFVLHPPVPEQAKLFEALV